MKKSNFKKLALIILTHNEERNIAECIKTTKLLNTNHDLIVIDDQSTDNTKKIANSLGAKVYSHSLNQNFAQQRNYGLSLTGAEWIMFLDADERFTPRLAKEIDTFLNQDDNLYRSCRFKRIDYFINRWLSHGEIGSIRLLRMARDKTGSWVGQVDEKWLVQGRSYQFKNPLLHYAHPDIAQFLVSLNERSTLNAGMFFDQGKKVHLWEWGKPVIKFVQNYIFRAGFLDGLAGFVLAVLMSCHSFLVRGKLYLLWKKNGKRR